MSISIECPGCSKKFRVKDELAGKPIKCPECGRKFRVAGLVHVESRPTSNSPPNADTTESETTTGDGTSDLVLTLGLASVVLLVTLGLSIYCLNNDAVEFGRILLLLASLSGVVVACVVRVFLARSYAFGTHAKEVDLFFGLVKLVLWNPNEGVVILRNKDIFDWDDNPHDGGGARLIFPLLGDELAMRVDLTVHRTEFIDKNVRTLDGLLLTIRGNCRWGISNIRKYYLSMSGETHQLNDRGFHDIGTSRNRSRAWEQ